MVNGLWGKKLGMAQVFTDDYKVVPVTAIDIGNWCITQVKTKQRDGYDALQVGCVKPKYTAEPFSEEWLKKPKKYFSVKKEVKIAEDTEQETYEVGQSTSIDTIMSQGDSVDVFGQTIGKGFQGVIKRHGFSGGKRTHGDQVGRAPGSIGFMTGNGRVMKGKKLPGHMGDRKTVMKNLEIVKLESGSHVVFVKGSVPGKSGSLVFVRRSR